MTRNFIYELNGPSPPEKAGLGRWGFCAFLDKKLAVKLRDIELNQENYERLNKEASEIITAYGLDDGGEVTPYDFIEGSWFVGMIKVPEDSCDLSLKCHDRESFLEGKFEQEKAHMNKEGSIILPVTYMPHNVDSPEQAFCLSSLFTHWANHVNAVFNS